MEQVYFITNALFSPSSLSVASIGTLQNTATSLRFAILRLEFESKNIPSHLDNIIAIYDALRIDPSTCVIEGEAYPLNRFQSNGMQIKAR